MHVVLAGVFCDFIATLAIRYMPSTKSHASFDLHLRAFNLGAGNVPQTLMCRV